MKGKREPCPNPATAMSRWESTLVFENCKEVSVLGFRKMTSETQPVPGTVRPHVPQ